MNLEQSGFGTITTVMSNTETPRRKQRFYGQSKPRKDGDEDDDDEPRVKRLCVVDGRLRRDNGLHDKRCLFVYLAILRCDFLGFCRVSCIL